ncbi:nuclear transport factor 2 family protein [Microbacterium album]|uniref:SnoaL-like domain-containing protein n=1 Tax=Microbacterium album TaxID=2053191 RepID=A0A917MMJ7_9MICO|nr:nuclear transport factor 2 family protein [Microbacterium album]GGH44809.1 hypothetical protein GCM10010921_19750 [Microbacterium album]
MAFRAVSPEARAAIADLNARWAWAVDGRDYEVLRDILHPDVHWVGHGGELHGRDAVVASYTGRTGNETRTTRHGLGNLLLEQVDERTVRGRSTWHNFASNEVPPGPPAVYLVADFRDTYVRGEGDTWLLRERIIEGVFREPSLGPPGLALGHGQTNTHERNTPA